MITLVLATAYDSTWALLRDVFDDEPRIALLRATPDEFNGRSNLDTGVLVHPGALELLRAYREYSARP